MLVKKVHQESPYSNQVNKLYFAALSGAPSGALCNYVVGNYVVELGWPGQVWSLVQLCGWQFCG